jgi:8-amino-7-oxononanoate synthase
MGRDFTSALYLGFWHESQALKPWAQLTTGKPAILEEPPGSEMIASRLAKLQGLDQSTLARSTLHLFWDFFGMLAEERVAIFQDSGSYSIAQWGIERAAYKGVPVYRFPHKDVDALQRLLNRPSGGRKPVIVTDGICTTCGCTVPIKAYHELVRRAGGLLVIDDTQAIGILGEQRLSTPYGTGGGGSLRYQNVSGPNVVSVSSLAKGFGVPLAVFSGSRVLVQKFKSRSQTRIHCSPPSVADVHAGERALDLNSTHGDAMRLQLAQRVQQFRRQAADAGLSADGGLFPIQTPRLPAKLSLEQVHQELLDLGIRTVLRRGCDGAPSLSLIITARHSQQDIENVVRAMAGFVSEQPHAELEGG